MFMNFIFMINNKLSIANLLPYIHQIGIHQIALPPTDNFGHTNSAESVTLCSRSASIKAKEI